MSNKKLAREWQEEYEQPVVRAASVHSTKFHKIDPTVAEPTPACVVNYETHGYVVKEHSFAERARSPCQAPECFGKQE